jgi:hypothetical protein
MAQQLRIINNVSIAAGSSSASSSALVIPTGLIRVVSSVESHISFTTTAGTATAGDMVIGAGQVNLFLIPDGTFINGLRAHGTNGVISISCVSIGR